MSKDNFKLSDDEAKKSRKYIIRGLLAGGSVQLLKAAVYEPDWFFYAEGVIVVICIFPLLRMAERMQAGQVIPKRKMAFMDFLFGYAITGFLYYTIKGALQ